MKYCVIGLGQSGRAAARVLSDLGHHVVGLDDNADACKRTDFIDTFTDPSDALADVDCVVVSPGVAPKHPAYQEAMHRGIDIIGEVELAWRLQHDVYHNDARWLCVTGTNGKTTTVGMAHAMAQAAGLKSVAVGNIGTPVIDAVSQPDIDVLVVELSSFQLHTVSTVSPHASICLNVAEDHIDWHGSAEAYRADKARVYHNTRLAAIYNLADEATLHMVEDADVIEGARAIGITLGHPAISQLGIVDDILVDRAYLDDRKHQALELATFADFDHLGGVTPALATDALAAAALVRAIGVPPDAVGDGLRNFHQAKHRRAVVGTKAQLVWIDDSKATNAHAAKGSLSGMADKSVIWIVGGDAKGQDFHSLIGDVLPALRAVIVIGKDQQPFKEAFEAVAPDLPRVHIKDVRKGETLRTMMEDIVHQAIALSVPGNTVMLAPACASWDQFDNYGQRGDLFAEVVNSLE